MTNSTFSQNSGPRIFSEGATTVNYSTIYGSDSATALLGTTSGGSIILTNTIVDNPTGRNCETIAGGTIVDGGYNLVFDTSCGVSSANHSLIADPLLLPLTFNGGRFRVTRLPTQEIILIATAPRRGVEKPVQKSNPG